MSDELDGDGIGGAVLEVLTGNAFRLLVSHTRKDNKGDYGKTEKIIMGLIKEEEEGQRPEPVSYTHLTLPTILLV